MADEFHRELPCELTDDEVAERAARMADAVELRDEREVKRKEVNAALKREVDALIAEIKLLAETVRLRRELRDVLCVTRVQRDGSIIIVRTDTDAVVEVRNAVPGTQQPLWHDETNDDDDDEDEDMLLLGDGVQDAEVIDLGEGDEL